MASIFDSENLSNFPSTLGPLVDRDFILKIDKNKIIMYMYVYVRDKAIAL